MGGQRHAPAAFTAGKDPVPIAQEVGWAPGSVWIGAENLAPPTGIRSPDLPARSESLYRLSYPGPHLLCVLHIILVRTSLVSPLFYWLCKFPFMYCASGVFFCSCKNVRDVKLDHSYRVTRLKMCRSLPQCPVRVYFMALD
jgi:hypothetical protein